MTKPRKSTVRKRSRGFRGLRVAHLGDDRADTKGSVERGWRRRGLPKRPPPGWRYLAGAWVEDIDRTAKRPKRLAIFFYGYFYGCTLLLPRTKREREEIRYDQFSYRLVGDRIHCKAGYDKTDLDDPQPSLWSYSKGKLSIAWPYRPVILSPTTRDDLLAMGFDRMGLMFVYAEINTALNAEFEERVDHLPLVYQPKQNSEILRRPPGRAG